MDPQTLIKLYQQGRKDFSGVDLTDANLSYSYLPGINFTNARLTNANLIGVNLTSANLTGANLSQANIISAYLGEVDLRATDLSKANFSYSYLAEANLTGSYFCEANFSYCYLSRAIVIKSSGMQADFTKSNLNKANLIRADLSGAIFQQAYLTKSNLSKANLYQANLKDANLIGCEAFGTNFPEAIFTGACIEDWLINEQTIFEKSICDYIYLSYDWINDRFQSRLPYNPQEKFATGEFEHLQYLEKTRTIVSLIFHEGIDWQIFLQTWDLFVDHLQKRNNNRLALEIESIEKKRDGNLIIKIDVPASLDKLAVAQWFLNQYNSSLSRKKQNMIATHKENEPNFDSFLQKNSNLTNLIRKIAV
jgi:uncharacterized protein YjbI with pentapeptide repeats